MNHNRRIYNRNDNEHAREIFNVAVDSLETVFDNFVDFIVGNKQKKDNKYERELFDD